MRRPKVSSLLIVLFLFIFFLILFFPYGNLKGYIFSKVYASTNVLIVADDMSISFIPPGASLKNVSVTLPLGDTELELGSEKLGLRIGAAAFFPPAPAIAMNLKKLKKGGDLYLKFGQIGKVFSINLDASLVNLEQISLPAMARPLQGTLGSDTNVKIDQADLSKSTGKIEIKGDNIRTPAHMVEGMPGMSFAIPGLNIGKLDSIINLRNGVMELSNITFGNAQSDLSGTITGDLKLAQDFNRSQVNVTVRLKLAPRIVQDPQNKTFVSFLEGYQINPGEYGMRWNAMVAELSGLSIKVLPDKLTN